MPFCIFPGESALAALRAEIDGRWRRSLTTAGLARRRAGSVLKASTLAPRLEHVGRVAQVGDGVAIVSGLPETRLDELLVFAGGVRGLAVDLGEETIGCVLLGDTGGIAAGSIVHGTGEVARVPVGDACLGRVVDPLGMPLDGGAPVAGRVLRPGRAAGAGDRRSGVGDAAAGDRASGRSTP